MNKKKLAYLTDYLLDAEYEQRAVENITRSLLPTLTVEQAYQIQENVILIKQKNGAQILGPKMGLTSQAKMSQMQVSKPIYGYTFKETLLPTGGRLDLRHFIHPKVEPEIAFILKEAISGREVTQAEVVAKTAFVLPAIEIIDSRYHHFKFTLADVIADNTSAAGVVLGNNPRRLKNLDIAKLGVSLRKNGQLQAVGTGAAVLENPIQAIISLAKLLAEKNQVIPPYQPILTGGLTAAIPLVVGDYIQVIFHHDLGEVSFFVSE